MSKVRMCPACRAASPSRPCDPLCPPCTRAAHQTVPCPLWPFDSPLMRRVLAEVNAPAVLAVFRAAAGLSQSDVAAMAGWDRAALGYYERGQRGAVFDIRALLGFADAVGMPREALLPLMLGDADAATLHGGVAGKSGGAGVDRRSFGGLAAGAAVAATLREAAVPSRVAASHIKYLQASVGSLWARDGVVGGAALLRPALRQWQLARRMLKQSDYTETVGSQLLVVAGYLADVAGWLAVDAADLPLAQKLYSKALDLATNAEDPVLTAWVLNNLSYLCSYQASRAAGSDWSSRNVAQRALLLSDRAAEEARYEPAPWLHVRIALRYADAASLTGNQVAFRSAIARAQRELDRAPGVDEPQWLQGFQVGADLITGMQARGLANLGDHARAEALYRELVTRDQPRRTRSWHGARLARVQLARGAGRDATATGRDVLAMVEDGVKSTRTVNELRSVRAVAGESGDEEFCARFDAVERALTAA